MCENASADLKNKNREYLKKAFLLWTISACHSVCHFTPPPVGG